MQATKELETRFGGFFHFSKQATFSKEEYQPPIIIITFLTPSLFY